MTNSENRQKAHTIIKEIFELIDEAYLYRLFDEPIKEAAQSFAHEETAPVTPKILLRAAGDLVGHLYEHGLKPTQMLTDSEARAEALAILEAGYESVGARGYDAAVLDASNPALDGLGIVLGQMTEWITAMARARHIRWVCARRIDPSNWPLRCLIAETLLERSRAFLPSNLLHCSPAQFADHLPQLISLLHATDATLAKMLGAEINP
jgi:hypothetical protein